ncbi:MAG: DUF5067 domain-containing protein [Coriobacteriaceae bacterium]|nr:DUF5067 domain-containing protein [Coriobacteriaceae bacterium]
MKLSKAITTGIFSFVLTFALFGCGGGGSSSTSGSSSASEPEAASKETATKEKIAESEYAVTIEDSRIGEDYEGKKALIVNYSFTNSSEEPTSFLVAIMPQAFQNGVELSTATISFSDDSYDHESSLKDIKPGATITVSSAFILDDSSVVTVECHDWLRFDSDTLIATKDFTVE